MPPSVNPKLSTRESGFLSGFLTVLNGSSDNAENEHDQPDTVQPSPVCLLPTEF